jgi:hypothetical protein
MIVLCLVQVILFVTTNPTSEIGSKNQTSITDLQIDIVFANRFYLYMGQNYIISNGGYTLARKTYIKDVLFFPFIVPCIGKSSSKVTYNL